MVRGGSCILIVKLTGFQFKTRGEVGKDTSLLKALCINLCSSGSFMYRIAEKQEYLIYISHGSLPMTTVKNKIKKEGKKTKDNINNDHEYHHKQYAEHPTLDHMKQDGQVLSNL